MTASSQALGIDRKQHKKVFHAGRGNGAKKHASRKIMIAAAQWIPPSTEGGI